MRSFLSIFLVLISLSAFAIDADKKYLNQRDINLIKQNWPDYSYASQKVGGIPVLLLPAIHYREAGLYKGYYSKKRRKVVKNIGGPFMLDFGPVDDHVEFARRIRAHEKRVYRFYGGTGLVPKVSHDFRFAVLVAAHHLKLKTRCALVTEHCIADVVWGYNGRASWHVLEKGDKPSHENSSYVWSDPKGGVELSMQYRDKHKRIVKFMDTRAGVMVLYKELVILAEKGELK